MSNGEANGLQENSRVPGELPGTGWGAGEMDHGSWIMGSPTESAILMVAADAASKSPPDWSSTMV